MNKSPFSTARFEYESENLYYLPDDLVTKMEIFVPQFLIGSRGTGKTTFLRALWWKERLHNNSLKEALGSRGLFDKFIGLYLKLPTIQIGAFASWSPDILPDQKGLVFSYYLELMICQQAVEAVHELAKTDIIDFSIEDENELCKEIVSDYKFNIFKALTEKNCITLKQVERILWQTHVELARQIKTREYLKTLSGGIVNFSFGEFCRTFIDHLQNLPL